MEDILETTHLEFDKSSFLIEIIKHRNGKKYVEINQTIHENDGNLHSIKINPQILDEIIDVLQQYQSKLLVKSNKPIPEDTQREIQNRYLKGISLKELALQFRLKQDVIEGILRSRGIEIISNEIPKNKKYRKRYKKK